MPAHLQHRAALKQGYRAIALHLFPLPPRPPAPHPSPKCTLRIAASPVPLSFFTSSQSPPSFHPRPSAPHPQSPGPSPWPQDLSRHSFQLLPRSLRPCPTAQPAPRRSQLLPRSARACPTAQPVPRRSQHLSRTLSVPSRHRRPQGAPATPRPRPLPALRQSAPRFSTDHAPLTLFPPLSLGRASRQSAPAR